MNNNLIFDFTVDKNKNTIFIKREFDAKLPLVWDAYTKSEILDRWWAPKPWKAKTKYMDFKPGGSWHYAMVGPDNEEHWSLMNYSTINYHSKFVGMDSFADEEGNINKEMPLAKWEVKFTSKGNSTLVEFFIYYDDLSQLETIIKMGFKEGMMQAMEALDDLLPTLK